MESLDEFWSVAPTLIPVVAIAVLVELRFFRDEWAKLSAIVQRIDAGLIAGILIGLAWGMYVSILHLLGSAQSDLSAAIVGSIIGAGMLQVLLRPIMHFLAVAFSGWVPIRNQMVHMTGRLRLLRVRWTISRTIKRSLRARKQMMSTIAFLRIRLLLTEKDTSPGAEERRVKLEDLAERIEDWSLRVLKNVDAMQALVKDMHSDLENYQAQLGDLLEAKAQRILKEKF